MNKSDQMNIKLAEAKSQQDIDKINSEFYGRFRYPGPPDRFVAFPEQQFGVTMLNQDIGCWDNSRIAVNPKILVAGCGTNQAVYTALKFPESEVLGTDVSNESLEDCQYFADQTGVKNLRLENKSINSFTYKDEFDYIICTGVLHHNARPQIALKKLAEALHSNGIMEVFVYNYYHTILMAAIQKAIRLYSGTNSSTPAEFEQEFDAVKKITRHFKGDNLMTDFLNNYKKTPDAQFANTVIQPVLHNYTVESWEKVMTECNLEYLIPCINQLDKGAKRLTWNVQFDNAEMVKYYESLPDTRRWQLGNLLLLEKSPMIWFYLQRKDSDYKRKSERQVCQEFIKLKFEKKTTIMKVYVRTDDCKYKLQPEHLSYPAPPTPPEPTARAIFNAVTPGVSMGDIFHQQKIRTTFSNVNFARIYLTTSGFPYLSAVT